MSSMHSSRTLGGSERLMRTVPERWLGAMSRVGRGDNRNLPPPTRKGGFGFELALPSVEFTSRRSALSRWHMPTAAFCLFPPGC